MKSTSARYGAVAVTLHWLSAVLILALVGTGFRAASLTGATAKTTLLQLHVPLGLTILVLTLLRIGWWVLADRRPDPLPGQPRGQRAAASVVHGLLYVVTFGMAVSGIGMLQLSGAGESVFGAAPLPDFHDYRPRAPHGAGARLLLALLALHVAAALWHHLVRRDGSLRRMWYGW